MFRKNLALFVLGFLLTASLAAVAATPTDLAVQAALSKDLAKYPHVAVKVEDRVATLSGSVQSYLEKQAAGRKAKSYGAVTRVANLLVVEGPRMSDQELAEKLARKLAYDRSMQGNLFNWFTVSVDDGRVTVAGYSRDYVSRDSALALVASTTGVRDLVDKVEVLPVSIFDDQIRILAARRIYGSTQIHNALDPAHPIRIIVRNGNVTLEGTVSSAVDRALAGNAVAGIPGVFSVENHLQVTRG